MFAMGALPGPTCLMKLLRHRFPGTAHGCRPNEAREFPGAAHDFRHVELYTTAEAVALNTSFSWQCTTHGGNSDVNLGPIGDVAIVACIFQLQATVLAGTRHLFSVKES